MKKIRVALFSNYYWGASLLHEMLDGPYAPHVEVVGIATDKYSIEKQNKYDCSYETLLKLNSMQRAQFFYKRIWSEFFKLGKNFYEQSRRLLPQLARKNKIPLFKDHWIRKTQLNQNGGRTTIDQVTDRFAETLVRHWRPNLIISANYGQKIPTDVVKLVTPHAEKQCLQPGTAYREHPLIAQALATRTDDQYFGCYNFHPATYRWPSPFAGGNVFALLEQASRGGDLDHFCMVMHQLRWEYDTGDVHKRSSPIPLFAGMSPIEIYFSCAGGITEVFRQELAEIVSFKRVGL